MVNLVIIMSNKHFYFKSSYLVFSFVALLSAFSQTVWAQTGTFTVCASGCDYDTPVSAINNIDRVPGDIIDVQTGTYVLNATLQVDKLITIQGNGSVFDANGIRAINVFGSTAELNLWDVTIKNGQSNVNAGGAISVWNGAKLTVYSGIFENNQAESGGAILNSGSDIGIYESRFSGNRATVGFGGAILTYNGGKTRLVHTEIDDNMSNVDGGGGGLLVGGPGSWLNVNASTVSNNAAMITLSNSALRDTSATISCTGGPLTN